jgi:hypothetical protein
VIREVLSGSSRSERDQAGREKVTVEAGRSIEDGGRKAVVGGRKNRIEFCFQTMAT